MSDEENIQPNAQNTDQPAEPSAEGEQVHMPEIRVEDVLRYSIGMFSEQAWIHLGIRTNPVSKETTADYLQAKLAIDALNALVIIAEGHFDPHEVRDMKNLVGSLQLNYVQRMV